MNTIDSDISFMKLALRLAEQGRGFVEPNPMVGCVVVRDGQVIGEGWHRKFGEAHAEVNALAAAGEAAGSTVFVTLEPCCHVGKTPPCTNALIQANVGRVVVATLDPSEKVAGKGVQTLLDAGVSVDVGVCQKQADRLISPFRKLALQKKPWMIAKWAMSLDGKIATRSGDSRWISNEQSRRIVHEIRGQVDAIIIGSGTAQADDPLLTARPSGARTALRVVVDSTAVTSVTSKLVESVDDIPVLIFAGPHAEPSQVLQLRERGCEVLVCPAVDRNQRLVNLLDELGRRDLTNVLCEGGSRLLGTLFDLKMIDEVHAFIAPKLIGGENPFTPIAGEGYLNMPSAPQLQDATIEILGDNVHVNGLIEY